jgi:peptide/nickel transport system substrate-binding protein
MRGTTTWAGLAIAAAMAMAGCGSNKDDGGGPGPSRSGAAPAATVAPETANEGKRGGDITFLAAGDVDFLDPGQTYYQFTIQIHGAISRSLYAISPVEGNEAPVPDLAAEAPEISPDNKTLTIKLREGVKYAPPVDREVTSADVKYAIERAFTTNVPNGYASLYFSEIEGAPKSPVKLAELESFPGLQTPDDHTLVIKLTEPVAARVALALVMPITIPVPEEYASKFDAETPTTYDQYVAFSGPYMVENDPKTGEVTGREPGKSISLVRNPNWDADTDFRPAYLDSIKIDEGNTDSVVTARRALAGQHLLCCDSSLPPPIILRDVMRKTPEQTGSVPGLGMYWLAMNSKKPPLDNINVRKAIIAAADRDAMQQVRGGPAAGTVASHFLPPGLPGFEESGGLEGFEDLDFLASTSGDMAVARKYMDLAAKDGVPIEDGKYVGNEELDLVVSNSTESLKQAQVDANEVEKLGLKVKIRQVPQDTLYSKFCTVPKNEPAFCAGVGWFPDFPDPESMMAAPFGPVTPAANNNMSLLPFDEVHEAMAAASAIQPGPERAQAWADINHDITEQAPLVPQNYNNVLMLQSADMHGVMNPFVQAWDLSFSSVK